MATADEAVLDGWSLFSGIGGLDLGFERAGIRVVLQCEADEWRRGVLAERFPGRVVTADVCDLARGAAAVPRPGIVFGGFPCQDVSVAGRRAGLAGERSGLFFEFARIVDAVLDPGGWLVIENVPGLLTSNGGRDFAVIRATLAELGFHDLAWRVVDSRYLGVPQRRRRVFIVARRARGRRAAEVLLEPESGGGDFAPRREAGSRAAGAAGGGAACGGGDGVGDDVGPLQGRIGKGRGWTASAEEAAEGNLIPATPPGGETASLTRAMGNGTGQAPDFQTYVPVVAHAVVSHGGNDKHDTTRQTYVEQDAALALTAHHDRGEADVNTYVVAGTLKGQRGRGGGGIGPEETLIPDTARTLISGDGGRGVAGVNRDSVDLIAADAPEVAHTLKSQDGRGWSHDAEATYVLDESATLTSAGNAASQPNRRKEDDVNLVAYRKAQGAHHPDDDESWVEADEARTLNGFEAGAARASTVVAEAPAAMGVRRLTPRECERLQGFPDDWTDLGPDSRRYSALGDAVTVNVSEWLGRRIVRIGLRDD